MVTLLLATLANAGYAGEAGAEIARADDGIVIHRWEVVLQPVDDVPVVVLEFGEALILGRGPDAGESVVVGDMKRYAFGGSARLTPLALGGCGASQKGAPPIEGLDPRWRYIGTEYTPQEWCLPAGKGVVKLAFSGDPANFPPLARLVSQLADWPFDPGAPAWTPPEPKRWRYPMITWLTYGFRSWTPASVNPRGSELFRASLTIPVTPPDPFLPVPWQLGVDHDAHVMKGLAVGWELHTAGRIDEEGGFVYAARGLVGGGGFFLPHLGAAAYTGLGFGSLGDRSAPCFEVPVEGIVLAGASHMGVEFLARFSAQLTDDRPDDERVLGMFIDPYFRLGGWIGTRYTKRFGRVTSDAPDYSEWGSRVFYLGVFNLQAGGDPYVGVTVGMSYALTDPV